MPANLENEDIFMQEVRSGRFTIDDWGRIFNVYGRRLGSKTKDGYLRLMILRDGRSVTAFAHRLVYREKTGPIPAGMTINHKNGNKADNRPMNLEVASFSQQQRHAIYVLGKNQRVLKQHGEKNFNAKLSNDQVSEIRRRYSEDLAVTHRSLAEEFQCSKSNIHYILLGHTRKSQGGAIGVRLATTTAITAASTNQAVPPS